MLLGRVDDVMNVSGHRLSTQEIESALVSHHMVAEAAVVGAADEATGQAVVAFVIIKSNQAGAHTADEASTLLRAHVAQQIGALPQLGRLLIGQRLRFVGHQRNLNGRRADDLIGIRSSWRGTVAHDMHRVRRDCALGR